MTIADIFPRPANPDQDQDEPRTASRQFQKPQPSGRNARDQRAYASAEDVATGPAASQSLQTIEYLSASNSTTRTFSDRQNGQACGAGTNSE